MVDTNPSDPPTINAFSLKPAPRDRVPPQAESLPRGWDSTAWFALVHAAAGPSAVQNAHSEGASDPDHSVLGWQWGTAQVKDFDVSAVVDAGKNPVNLLCSAQGFDPADQQAVKQVTAALALCGTAAFPGAEPAAAGPWVAVQEADMVPDLKKTAQGGSVVSASPTFGAGVYWLQGFYAGEYGYTIELNVM